MIDIENLTLKVEALIKSEKKSNPDIQYLNESHSKLISQIISNFELSPNADSSSAEMIFLGAPTGSGKDTLARKIISSNPDKKYVILNMDMFRHYHDEIYPNDKQISDKNFAEKTNQTSYELYYIIQEVLLREFPGTNIIVTGTIRDLDWVKEIVDRYKNDSKTHYTVSLATLAVPIRETAFSIFERYLTMVDSRDSSNTPLRYTTLSYHDDTVSKFLSNIRYFEDNLHSRTQKRYFDRIQVYRRSKDILDLSEDTLIYDSKTPDPNKCAFAHIFEVMHSNPVIEQERINRLKKIISSNKDYLQSQNLYDSISENIETICSKQVRDIKETRD